MKSMTWEKLGQNLLEWVFSMGPRLIAAILIVAIGWWCAKFVRRLLKRAMENPKTENGVLTFVGSISNILIKAFAVIIAMSQLGFDMTTIITALGACGVAVALALQNSLSNVASGVQILINHPFRVGDYVSLGGFEGTVQRIEIMTTALFTADNKEVVIPNSQVTSSVITNYSAQTFRRIDLSYGVSYQADLQKAKEVVRQVIERQEMVVADPEPLVAVGAHRDSSVEIVARVWCEKENYWPLYYAMQEQVKMAFDRENIEIPFPQMDVHLHAGEEKS